MYLPSFHALVKIGGDFCLQVLFTIRLFLSIETLANFVLLHILSTTSNLKLTTVTRKIFENLNQIETHHIGTRLLICRAIQWTGFSIQWTGFYIRWTSVMKELHLRKWGESERRLTSFSNLEICSLLQSYKICTQCTLKVTEFIRLMQNTKFFSNTKKSETKDGIIIFDFEATRNFSTTTCFIIIFNICSKLHIKTVES